MAEIEIMPINETATLWPSLLGSKGTPVRKERAKHIGVESGTAHSQKRRTDLQSSSAKAAGR